MPANARNSVLLPAPVGPLIKTRSPGSMASVTPQIATEAMQVGMQWGSDILKRIQQRLKEKGYSVTTD